MMKNYYSEIVGGALLVAGTTIGAGMLALPITSGLAGFIPSTVLLLVCFLFMLATLFLLLEANLYSKDMDANIITMSGEHLGKIGQGVAWISFLFLLYAVMAAYMSAGGTFVTHFIQANVGHHLVANVGLFCFAGVVAMATFLGARVVDYVNRIMVVGLFSAYVWLIFFGLPKVQLSHLMVIGRLQALWAAVPVVALSFTSHLILPSLRSYFKGALSPLKWSLLLGSLLPFGFYLVWQIFVLGILPLVGNHSLTYVSQGVDTVDGMVRSLGHVIHLPGVSAAVGCFSFFAVMTSFLGVALSLVDFLADGLGWNKRKQIRRLGLILISFLPPLWFSLYYPAGFLMALGYAGLCIAILYGILPVLMVWRARYYRDKVSAYRLPGGRFALVVLGGGSMILIFLQLFT